MNTIKPFHAPACPYIQNAGAFLVRPGGHIKQVTDTLGKAGTSMKRTVCFIVACALGLTISVSAQTVTPRDNGNHNTMWAGNFSEHTTNTFAQLNNSPNPFATATVIEYTIETPGHVRLNIYNSNEFLIEALVDEYQDAGRHSVIWNIADRASGVYICTLNCGNTMYTRDITVLK